MKEGSFEGLMSGLDFNSSTDQKPNTPDQMPERINLSQVPEQILRSNVMESLISQNDDLMARLNVSLRRISLLEEKCTDAKNETAQFREQYDNLRDQVLILKEQAKVLAGRNRDILDKQKREGEGQSELKEQIRLLEIRYAELFTAGRDRQAKIEAELVRSDRSNSRYRKYRQGIRRALVFLREEVRGLRGKKALQEATIQDLRKNLQETTAYITEQNKEHKNSVLGLTSTYEMQIKGLNSEIELLIEQNKALAARGENLDKVQSEKIRLENDLIIADRRFEDLQMQTSAEITDVQKALGRYRNDSKDLAIELENKNAILEGQTEELAAIKSERSAMTEQVETLQLLWRDQQVQVEKLTEQKSALQKLNQELSISINEYRREVRELKEQVESENQKLTQFQKQSEIKDKVASLARDSQIREAKTAGSTAGHRTDTSETAVLRANRAPDLMAKIDKALTNLHVGK